MYRKRGLKKLSCTFLRLSIDFPRSTHHLCWQLGQILFASRYLTLKNDFSFFFHSI